MGKRMNALSAWCIETVYPACSLFAMMPHCVGRSEMDVSST